MSALDPSINKTTWTLQNDLEFLEKWLLIGNKWKEISTQIEGRTESQLKNRFKLLLRREQPQLKNCNHSPNELKDTIVPQIIAQLQKRIQQGSDNHRDIEEEEKQSEEESFDREGDFIMST